MTTMLNVAAGLRLDADYVGGGTFALLAKKGAGKTYTARVLAEEFWRTKVPFVAIDPMGAMWGLRASADGQGDGLPVPIFGGDHGDVPLERGGGEVLADLVVDERVSMILDLSGLGSRAAEREFARAFLERLYRRNSELVHLLVDEADLFAPQKPQAGDQPLLGTTENIVRRGRNHGIGITLITQRPAVLNKDVLTQVDGLVAGRITGYHDREAIDDWVRGHGDQEVAREVKQTLAGLANGECWWWIPELDVLKRVQVRAAHTFDSSPTRKRGDQARQPKTLADVDLGAIAERMQATIERAKADDPRELRRRIKELEAQLANPPEPERVEVPVLTDDAREALEEAAAAISTAQGQMVDAIADASRRLGEIVSQVGARPPAPAPVRPRATTPAPTQRSDPPPRRPRRFAPAPDRAEGVAGTPAKQRILDALAALETMGIPEADRTQLALFAQASPKSSGYANNLGALRTAGLIDYPTRGRVMLTDNGRERADATDAPSTVEELHAYVRDLLSPAKWRLIEVLIGYYPASITREALAEEADVSAASSGFANNLGSLRSLGLIDYPSRGEVAAEPVLFLGAAHG